MRIARTGLAALLVYGAVLATGTTALATPSPVLGDPGTGSVIYVDPSVNDATGINVVTGNLVYGTDLIGDSGFNIDNGPLELSAYYNSHQTTNPALIATGWSLSSGPGGVPDIF